MAGFVVRKITVFSIFFNHQTIALVTLNNVLECCHFFIHVRYIHIFFYFRIDGQSSVQFSEYAKSANLGGVPHPPNTPLPTALVVATFLVFQVVGRIDKRCQILIRIFCAVWKFLFNYLQFIKNIGILCSGIQNNY